MRTTCLALFLAGCCAFGCMAMVQRAATSMENDLLRNRCQWHYCREESDMIYLGAGICDEHWEQACAVLKGPRWPDTTAYILAHVNATAAGEIRSNQEKATK